MSSAAENRSPSSAPPPRPGGGKRRRPRSGPAPMPAPDAPPAAKGWRTWLRHVLVNGLLVAVGGTLLLVVLQVAADEAPPAALAPVGGGSTPVFRHAPAVVFGAPRVGPTVVRPPRRLPILPAPRARIKPLLRTPMERARGGETVPVVITAYCLRGMTRLDHEVRLGIVAADPRYFPLGRDIDLSIGSRSIRARYRVDDTGSAIKGLRLDLWTPSCSDARRFGRRFGTAKLVERK